MARQASEGGGGKHPGALRNSGVHVRQAEPGAAAGTMELLDVEGDPALTGKTAGKDAASDKPTYPAILGLDASRALLAQLAQRMDGALATLACDAAELAALARFAAARGH